MNHPNCHDEMPSSIDRRGPDVALSSGQVGTGHRMDDPRRNGVGNIGSAPRQPEAAQNHENRDNTPVNGNDTSRKRNRPSLSLSLSNWRLERSGGGSVIGIDNPALPGLMGRLRRHLARQHRRLLRSSGAGSTGGSTAGASSSTSAFQRLPAELLLLVNEHLRYRDAWALKHACRYFFRVLDPGPKPKIPQTLAAWWDGKLVLYQTVVLGWRAGDTARSLLWGLNPSVYNPLMEEDQLRKQFVVDGHATLLHIVAEGNYHPHQQQQQQQHRDQHPQQSLQQNQVPGPIDGMINAAAGVIVTYSPLARTTFEAAAERCRALRARFDSKGVEVPVLLLGVNTATASAAAVAPTVAPNAAQSLVTNPLETDLGSSRREVDAQEAAEMAHSLGVGHCEVEVGGGAEADAGTGPGALPAASVTTSMPTASPRMPVDEPFVEIIRMIRRATDEYVGARMSQQNFGAAWRKRLVLRPPPKKR